MKGRFLTLKCIVLFSIMLIHTSCTNSPKKIITTGEVWIGSKTEIIDQYGKGSRVVFTEKSLEYLNDNTSLDINWLNENSCSFIDTDGKKKVMFFHKVSENKFEVASLWESDKTPKNKKDWDNLRFEGSAFYLIKKEIKPDQKTQNIYKVGVKSIPADKVPPAGLYALKNLSGETLALINVIIENGVVRFQTGENKKSLVDDNAKMEEDGGISFESEGFSVGKIYVGNGVIEDSGTWRNGNSGNTVKFIRGSSSD